MQALNEIVTPLQKLLHDRKPSVMPPSDTGDKDNTDRDKASI